ncbi:MAG: glycosyltransferase family 4 protein [Burkholderiales bacterium]|nr:glycosyltransferase family 4 protein [Burkholderiales bacterium]
MKPINILQISAFFAAHGGGIEVVAEKLGQAAAAQGNQVTWMATGTVDQFPGSSHLGMTCIRAPYIDPIEKAIGLPMPLWSLGALIKLWRQVGLADVVHIHDYLYFSSFFAFVFAKLRRKPVVLTQHIGEIPFKNRFFKILLSTINRTIGAWILARCGQVVFVGKLVKAYFEQITHFETPACLIANGVDHAIYHPSNTPHPSEASLRCLFVGRFVEKKGINLLRQCMDLSGIQWTFIGWGPLSPSDWHADEKRAILAIHENLRADQVVPHYQNADVLVLPSTGEGFPLVLQEALSCGTPVLVSQEVASAFERLDETCVYSAETRGDSGVEQLRAKLTELASKVEAIRQARETALTFAQQWGWGHCASEYLAIYTTLLEKQ